MSRTDEETAVSTPRATSSTRTESTLEKGGQQRELEAAEANGGAPISEKAPSAMSAIQIEEQDKPQTVSLHDDYPDGGLRAWIVVLGAWAISFVTWGFVNSYGVFLNYYTAHQLADKSSSAISFIGAFQLFMVLFCSILAGKAFDAGYLKYLMSAGTLLYAAGLFGLANAKTYAQIFLAQGVAAGLACGVVFLPAVSTTAHWFKKKRAFALGILATGSSVGGIVYPIMLNNFFNGSVGFTNGVRAVAALTVGLLVIATFALKTRLPVRKGGKIYDFSYFKDPEYSFLCAGVLFSLAGLYTPYFYLQEYALTNGSNVTPKLAFYGLAILNAASLFGRVIMNFLADRFGALTILTPNVAASAVLIFIWLAAGKNMAGFIVFALLYGFVSGALVSMIPACVAATTKQMNAIGVRMCMLFMVESFAGLAGTPLAGALYTRTHGYVASACFSGGLVMLGAACFVASRYFVVKEKGTWRV